LAAIGGGGLAVNVLWMLALAETLRSGGLRLAMALTALSALALAGAAVWDAAYYPDHWLWQRQGHPNMLASFLLGPFFLGLGVLGSRPGRRTAWLMGASAAACLALLTPARSTGAWVGLAAGGAVAGAVFLGPRLRRAALVALLAVAAAAATAALSALDPDSPLRRRILVTQQATRLLHLQASLAMFACRPVLGWGAGNFMSEFSDFKPAEGPLRGWTQNITLHPHNELALISIETGAAGLLLYLAAVVVTLRRAYASTPADPSRRWEVAACAGAFTASLVHGLFEVALRFWGPAAAHWAAGGMLLAATDCPGLPALSRCGRQAAALAAGILVIVCFTIPGQTAYALMGRAETLPKDPKRAEETAALYGRAAALSRDAAQHVRAHVGVAHSLRAAGQTDRAIAAYEALEALAPGLGPTRYELGRLLLNRFRRQGDRHDAARAADLLALYVRQRPDMASAGLLRAQALAAVSPEDPRPALGVLADLSRRHPNDPFVWAALGEALLAADEAPAAEETLGRAASLLGSHWGECVGRALGPPVLLGSPDRGTWVRARQARLRLASTCLAWARAAHRLGRAAEARRRLDLALHRAPDWPALRQDTGQLRRLLADERVQPSP
jgi:O-antigen ligase